MYCSECGAKIDGAKFCPNCGTPTGKNSDASPKVTKKETKPLKNGTEKKKWSMPIVIAAVVLLVIIVILIYNLIRKDSPFDFQVPKKASRSPKTSKGNGYTELRQMDAFSLLKVLMNLSSSNT